MFNVPKSDIPNNAIEGDILRKVDNKYVIDVEATKAAKDEIRNLINKLKK